MRAQCVGGGVSGVKAVILPTAPDRSPDVLKLNGSSGDWRKTFHRETRLTGWKALDEHSSLAQVTGRFSLRSPGLELARYALALWDLGWLRVLGK